MTDGASSTSAGDTLLPPPLGWGDDALSSFLQLTHQNCYATFANLAGSYRRLRDLDALFEDLLKEWRDPPNMIAASFAYRAHSAFRAATATSLAGQAPESFVLMRACLEHALYANHVVVSPKALEAWKARHDNEEATRAESRKSFGMSSVWTSLRSTSATLEPIARSLYDRCIDLGAHPNVRAVIGGMSVLSNERDTEYRFPYATGEDLTLKVGMRSLAQVAVAVLEVLFQMFPARAGILGLPQRLAAVKDGL